MQTKRSRTLALLGKESRGSRFPSHALCAVRRCPQEKGLNLAIEALFLHHPITFAWNVAYADATDTLQRSPELSSVGAYTCASSAETFSNQKFFLVYCFLSLFALKTEHQ
jgi:hypothetical protein